MTTIVQKGYDYSVLDTVIAETVQQAAVQIRERTQNIARSIVEIGRQLHVVKNSLPHGHWGHWLESEFAWSPEQARRYMRVAERFGESGMLPELNELDHTSLYLLASPQTPDEAVNDVLERVREGKDVPHTIVKEIVAEYKEPSQPDYRPGQMVVFNDFLYEVGSFDGVGSRDILIHRVHWQPGNPTNRTWKTEGPGAVTKQANVRAATQDDIDADYNLTLFKEEYKFEIVKLPTFSGLLARRDHITISAKSAVELARRLQSLPLVIKYHDQCPTLPEGWRITWNNHAKLPFAERKGGDYIRTPPIGTDSLATVGSEIYNIEHTIGQYTDWHIFVDQGTGNWIAFSNKKTGRYGKTSLKSDTIDGLIMQIERHDVETEPVAHETSQSKIIATQPMHTLSVGMMVLKEGCMHQVMELVGERVRVRPVMWSARSGTWSGGITYAPMNADEFTPASEDDLEREKRQQRINDRMETLETLYRLETLANEVWYRAKRKRQEMHKQYNIGEDAIEKVDLDDIEDEVAEWCRSVEIAE